MLSAITRRDIADWRDDRLREVSNGTVIREWALLSDVFEYARQELDLISVNPMRGVRKPVSPPPRDRLLTDEEIDKMLEQLNYSKTAKLKTQKQRVGAMMVFALETALRSQEICNLTWAERSKNERNISSLSDRTEQT